MRTPGKIVPERPGAWVLSAFVFLTQRARNTLDSARIPRASKPLICGLFQKGRVLAQDGVRDIRFRCRNLLQHPPDEGCPVPSIYSSACRCLRCLLLVMCTHPFAKKAVPSIYSSARPEPDRSPICRVCIVKTAPPTKSRTYAPLEFRVEDGETPPLCSTLLSSSSHLASVPFGRCVGAAPTWCWRTSLCGSK